MKNTHPDIQEELIIDIKKEFRKRVSDQVISVMRQMVDHTYLIDLMRALDSIEDFNNIESSWDSNIHTNYKPTAFRHGTLKQMGLWHAHFPINGSVLDMFETNFNKEKKRNHLVNCLVKANTDKARNNIIEEHCKKILGIGDNQYSKITADWLIFYPSENGNYFLWACKHEPSDRKQENIATSIRNQPFWPIDIN